MEKENWKNKCWHSRKSVGQNPCAPQRLPVLVFAIVVEAQMGMFGFPWTTPCMFCGIRAMACDMWPSTPHSVIIIIKQGEEVVFLAVFLIVTWCYVTIQLLHMLLLYSCFGLKCPKIFISKMVIILEQRNLEFLPSLRLWLWARKDFIGPSVWHSYNCCYK